VTAVEPRNSIQVIGRMLTVLKVLAGSGEPVALKALAKSAGLHPSTAHRILTALLDDRLVERIDPGHYRLGLRLLELGNLVKARIDVREHALPFMRKLHEATGEAVNLSVRRDDEIVYIERTSSGRALMRVVNIVGAKAPLHITAVGKLFLLEDGAQGLRGYAERTRLPAHTRNTYTSITALGRELTRVRKLGYAVDNEEAELGVKCIAAGVRDDARVMVAGLSVSAPTDRLKMTWSGLVCDTAQKISRAIGFPA
jgi:DNA-binding IclR family transcriptional regulator